MLDSRPNNRPVFSIKGPFYVAIRIVTVWSFLFNGVLSDYTSNNAWGVTTSKQLPHVDSLYANSHGIYQRIKIPAFNLPKNLGTVKERHSGTSSKTILYIQDAHCNYSCQKSVTAIIDHLRSRYGVTLAALEGGSGDYDLSIFTDIKNKEDRYSIADYFMKEGRITGAEFYAINNPERITLKGLEDPELYIKNLNVYRNTMMHQEEIDLILNAIGTDLDAIKNKVYSATIKEIDSARGRYNNKQMDFKDYLVYLWKLAESRQTDQSAFQNLEILIQTLKAEGDIDFKKCEKERSVLMSEIQNILSDIDTKDMVSYLVALKSNAIEKGEFYSYLLRQAELYGIMNEEKYPNLVGYTKYVLTYERLDKNAVFEELERMESMLFETYAENDDQIEMYRMIKDFEVLKNLFAAELTRRKYDYYSRNKRLFKVKRYIEFIVRNALNHRLKKHVSHEFDILDTYRTAFEQFYIYSFKRDTAFVDRLKVVMRKRNTAILFTGGFHTDNMRELLKNEGYSFVVILPNIDQIQDDCPYFRLLAGGKSYIERVVEQRSSLIAIPSMLSGMGVAGAEELDLFKLSVEVMNRFQRDGEVNFLMPYGFVTLSKKRINENSRAVGKIGEDIIYAVIREKPITDASVMKNVVFDHEKITDDGHQLMDTFWKMAHEGKGELSVEEVNKGSRFWGDIEKVLLRKAGRANKDKIERLLEETELYMVTQNGKRLRWRIGHASRRGIHITYAGNDEGIVRVLLHELGAYFGMPHEFNERLEELLDDKAALELALRELKTDNALRYDAWRKLQAERDAEEKAAGIKKGRDPATVETVLEGKSILKLLGLTYDKFKVFAKWQARFEKSVFDDNPIMESFIVSMRTQERFCRAVVKAVKDLRKAGIKNPLPHALLYAITHCYGDFRSILTGAADEKDWHQKITDHFSEIKNINAIRQDILRVRDKIPPYLNVDMSMEGRLTRAIYSDSPVLFREHEKCDKPLMDIMDMIVKKDNIELSVLWAHPFTSERQLIGHRVPTEDDQKLVFGYGELMKMVKKAQDNSTRHHVLIIKNIEGMEAEVRTQLQEALRIGVLDHPELGQVKIPKNMQIMFTTNEDANLQDDSFYDRVIVKTADVVDVSPESMISFEDKINNVMNQAKGDVKIRKEGNINMLVLPGAEIALSDEFKGINNKNLHDMIYLKTGLVLDENTIKMLVAMETAVKKNKVILRIQGPSGVGKTFTARGYSILRRAGKEDSRFLSNPISQGTELSDLIGGFEQDENAKTVFNGDTAFKDRLENGGVVALSELNTLIDHDDMVSLAWWLLQISEVKVDSDGYRTIRLSEIPTPLGGAEHTIRIHPDTLIVIDTNPEGYDARGTFPEIFEDYTDNIDVDGLISENDENEDKEIVTLSKYVDMFLKHDWVTKGVKKADGISDDKPQGKEIREGLVRNIAVVYRRIVSLYVKGESFGQGEKMVFTLRELKRITEDVLMGIAKGLDRNEALARACMHHLVLRWEDAEDQDTIRAILTSEFNMILPNVTAEEFFKEELLMMNRPVHARIAPQTDVKLLLREFIEENPDVTVKFVSISDETDRFMLEGGLVTGEDGRTLVSGLGVLGRLIKEAENNTDKRVVYVLDNIHNLRAEEAVALNEFLQEGKLYMKGKDLKLSLPQNAHILAISRSDSSWDWSEAEKSRYVTFSYDTKKSMEDYAERCQKINRNTSLAL